MPRNRHVIKARRSATDERTEQREAENIKFLRLVWEHRNKWLESPEDAKTFWAFIAKEFKDGQGGQILKEPPQARKKMYRLCIGRRQKTRRNGTLATRTPERTVLEEAKDAVVSVWAAVELLSSMTITNSRLAECLTPAAIRLLVSQMATATAAANTGNGGDDVVRDETHEQEAARLIFAPQIFDATEQFVSRVKTAPFGTQLEDLFAEALEEDDRNDLNDSDDDADDDTEDLNVIPSIEEEEGDSAASSDSEKPIPASVRVDLAPSTRHGFEKIAPSAKRRASSSGSRANKRQANMDQTLPPTPPRSSNPACSSSSAFIEQGPEVDEEEIEAEVDESSLLLACRGRESPRNSPWPVVDDIRNMDFSEFLHEPDAGPPLSGQSTSAPSQPPPSCERSLRKSSQRARTARARSRSHRSRRRSSTKFPSPSIPSSPRRPSPSLSVVLLCEQQASPSPPPGPCRESLRASTRASTCATPVTPARSESGLFVRQRTTISTPEPPRACASIERGKREETSTPNLRIAKRECRGRRKSATRATSRTAARRRESVGATAAQSSEDARAGALASEDAVRSHEHAPGAPAGSNERPGLRKKENKEKKKKKRRGGEEEVMEKNEGGREKNRNNNTEENVAGKGAASEPAISSTRSEKNQFERLMEQEEPQSCKGRPGYAPKTFQEVKRQEVTRRFPIPVACGAKPASQEAFPRKKEALPDLPQRRNRPVLKHYRITPTPEPEPPKQKRPVHIYFDEHGREAETEHGQEGMARMAASSATKVAIVRPADPDVPSSAQPPPSLQQTVEEEESVHSHDDDSRISLTKKKRNRCSRARSRKRQQSMASRRDSAMPLSGGAAPDFSPEKQQQQQQQERPEKPSPAKRQKRRHGTAGRLDPVMPSAPGAPGVRREPTTDDPFLPSREQRKGPGSFAEPPPPPPFVSAPNCEPSRRDRRQGGAVSSQASGGSTMGPPPSQPSSSAPSFTTAPSLSSSREEAHAGSNPYERVSKSVPPPLSARDKDRMLQKRGCQPEQQAMAGLKTAPEYLVLQVLKRLGDVEDHLQLRRK
ncbi:hypothetical protein PG990_014547 [Apiospora arundinis]